VRTLVRGVFAAAAIVGFVWLVGVVPHVVAIVMLLTVAVLFLRAWFRIESSLTSEALSPEASGVRDRSSFPGSSGVPGNVA